MIARTMASIAFVLISCGVAVAEHPVYIWAESEWFTGVKGSNNSWVNYKSLDEARGWGLNGPGVSAEWGQGGESEWNSIAAHKDESAAAVTYDFDLLTPGNYRVWVRYADWQMKTEPFKIRVTQGDAKAIEHEYGAKPVVDEHDEFKMYWSWVFAWDKSPSVPLKAGPTRITLLVDRPGEARRHVDAVLLTNDLEFVPNGREKPPFAYFRVLDEWNKNRSDVEPLAAAVTSGKLKSQISNLKFEIPAAWQRQKVLGQDIWMPWNMGTEFWTQDAKLPPAERMLVPWAVEQQIAKPFVDQFKGRKDVPIFSDPHVVPVFYVTRLGEVLANDSPVLAWLRETKKPFGILTNYGNFAFKSDQQAQECFANLKSLGDQFIGYVSGESIAHGAVVDHAALNKRIETGAKQRSDIVRFYGEAYDAGLRKFHDGGFKSSAGPMWDKLISCLSTHSTVWSHALPEWGTKTIGMETAAVMPNWSTRIAFARGAARQYGGNFFYYHAPNFGDTATTFTHTQNFLGPNAWFHSRYGLTFGPSISWYRKAYYLYYMSGASHIYLEQGFDQFFKPGPGEWPVQLNPLGRVTDEFLQFVAKHPDRGTPYTPVAFLLDQGHGWDDVHYQPAPFGAFDVNSPLVRGESDGDRMIRELFNVAFYPHPRTEGEPCTAERQSYVSGLFGNIFDVLVTSPTKRDAIHNYPVVILSGDVQLDAAWQQELKTYVERGGTLIENMHPTPTEPLTESNRVESDRSKWLPTGETIECTRFRAYRFTPPAGSRVLAQTPDGHPLIVERPLGAGKVITSTIPYFLDGTRRAHPLAAKLMIHLTGGLVPIKVVGDVQYLINRNQSGWVVTLLNNRGNYKPQQGLAPPRRDEVSKVQLIPRNSLQLASMWIGQEGEFRKRSETGTEFLEITIPAGGSRIIEFR
jgi:hypothetical protein